MNKWKSASDITLIGAMLLIITLMAIHWAEGMGVNKWLAVLWMIVPLPLNYYFAVTRGKHPILMLLLTIIFGWVITLILAFFPLKAEKR